RRINVVVTSSDTGGTVRIERVVRVGDEIWVVSEVGRQPGEIFGDAITYPSDSVVVGIPSLPIRHFIRGSS
ncbi:unnamed protein product, partial [Discosporangium mesarthrocarpum]